MIVLKNTNYDVFLSQCRDKNIIIFGTGKTFNNFIDRHTWDGRVLLLDKIIAVLDNNVSKSGWEIRLNKKAIKVETLDNYLKKGGDFDNCAILLMMQNRFLMQVVGQLDAIDKLDGVVCYYGASALDWGSEICSPLPINPVLPTVTGNYHIPNNIHYCWFGSNPIPDSAAECIKSWETHCTDYEIRLWNEDSYDISKTPLYVRQAYDAGKYAFVSDYARLDIINRYGGVYFDVDVELVRSIDSLLEYKAFFGFLTWSTINTGLGFGSVAGNKTLSDMMSIYELFDFVLSDDFYYTVDCPRFATEYFRRNGVMVNNTLQMVDDMLFLPSSYMSPFDAVMGEDGRKYLALYALQSNTISIHKCDGSWFGKVSDCAFRQLKEEYAPINERLYADWERSARHG